MMQIDFFLSEAERNDFIKYCIKHDCSIIPDKEYNTNKYAIASDINQYQQYCKKSQLLFIVSKNFSVYPLELDDFENGGRKKYFIKQRHGGPTIDFFSPIIGELENNIVGPGYIGIYPFYYHGNQKYVPGKSLINFYKLLTTYIKESCKKVKLTQRTFWVGKHTIVRAKNGEMQLLPISNIDILTLI